MGTQKFNETLNRKPVELLSVHSRMRHAIFKVSCNQQYQTLSQLGAYNYQSRSAVRRVGLAARD